MSRQHEFLSTIDTAYTFSVSQSDTRVSQDELQQTALVWPRVRRLRIPRTVDVKPEMVQSPETDNKLENLISFFDNNWRAQKLPEDWFNLKKKVGFSMQTQMDLLKDTTPESIAAWMKKTDYMVRGFTLEYLSPDNVMYPCKYEPDPDEPTNMIDKSYGNTDMVAMVSEKERNGSVRESLGKLKTFFLNGGDMAVMVSPRGPSGLTTDDGAPVNYRDSFFFVMKRDEQTGAVMNYTVKTDFTHQECREVIYQLTGKRLSPTAPLEDYARAIACFKKGKMNPVRNVSDVVDILAETRFEKGSTKVFEDVNFESVYQDIEDAESLYENDIAREMLTDFKAYCQKGEHTKLELQKALAATILRISKAVMEEEEVSKEVSMLRDEWYKPHARDLNYGRVLTGLTTRAGCAGGGENNMYVQSVTPRVGSAGGEDQYGPLKFICPACDYENERPRNGFLTKCGNEDCMDPGAVAC